MATIIHRFHVAIEISGDSGDDFRVAQEKYERAMKNVQSTQGINFVEQTGYTVEVKKELAKG